MGAMRWVLLLPLLSPLCLLCSPAMAARPSLRGVFPSFPRRMQNPHLTLSSSSSSLPSSSSSSAPPSLSSSPATSSSASASASSLLATVSSPAPPNFTQGCPPHPLDLCDFFFEGSEDAIPLLALPSGGLRDSPLSPPIRDASHAVNVPQGRVIVSDSGGAKFFCPAPPGTDSTGDNEVYSNGFYASNSGSFAFSQIRNTWDLGDTENLEGRCVLLPLTSVHTYSRDDSAILKLAPADGNALYPEARRCVVFATGPSPPSCPAHAPRLDQADSSQSAAASEPGGERVVQWGDEAGQSAKGSAGVFLNRAEQASWGGAREGPAVEGAEGNSRGRALAEKSPGASSSPFSLGGGRRVGSTGAQGGHASASALVGARGGDARRALAEGDEGGASAASGVSSCFAACPRSPTELCDFVMQNHKTDLPVFNLSKVLLSKTDLATQMRLAETLIKSSSHVLHYIGAWNAAVGAEAVRVKVSSIGFADFLGCVSAEMKSVLHSRLTDVKRRVQDGQYHGDIWRGKPAFVEQAQAVHRQQVVREEAVFRSMCVKLPLRNFKMSFDVKFQGVSETIVKHLSPADEHQAQVPDRRRCVVFRTEV